jgi:hypothetical protein
MTATAWPALNRFPGAGGRSRAGFVQTPRGLGGWTPLTVLTVLAILTEQAAS